MPLFTIDTEDLVEVEAKCNKIFGQMENFLYLCTRYQTLQGIMSTAKVTLINKRDGKERYTRHEMSDVVEMIRTGKLKSGKLIDELTERPLVCFSSMLMTKGPYQWADVYNGCVLLEINSLPDRQTAEEIRDEARFIPYTVIAFVGADGRSVKIVSQAAERDMWQNPDGYELKDVEQFHRNAYAKYHYIYSTQLAVRVDNIPPTLRSGCLLSHDPDVYFNDFAATITVSPFENTAERLTKTARLGDDGREDDGKTIPGLTTEALRRHEFQACKADALEACRLDKKEDFVAHCLEVLAFNCHESGIEEAFAVRMTLFDGRLNEDAEYVQTVFDSQYSKTLKATWPLKHVKPSQLLTYKTESFLNSRYELRKNVMTGVAQYRSKDSYDYSFRDLTKEVMNTMSIRALKAGLDSWDKDIKRYVESTMIPQFDPVNEWLEQLPRWDGVDRVTPLAQRVVTRNKHWISDFHTWMLSMVAHWKGIDRNHGNAIVPMLIGDQGCGKTAFCGIILPEELRDYYNDKIDFKNDTAINLGLTSFALINIDEFDALSKSQQPLLKHLISKSDVKMRPPYGKAYEQRRRYASFIATTNNLRPLPDDKSGSRRFVCVVVEGPIDYLSPVDYPQLYAQLVTEISEGRRYWFDDADNQRIISENRRFEHIGSIERMISETFMPAPDDDNSNLLSVDEIVAILNRLFPNFHLTKSINSEVGRALNQLGYNPHKTNTCQKYHLVKREINLK